MKEVSIAVKAMQFLAVLLLTAYFAHTSYQIYSARDKWASTFYSAYGNFESWWNKQFKRILWNEFAYSMPDQKELYPYKAKVALILGYCNAFGSLLLITGEKWAALILLVPQVVQTLVVNGPSFAKTQTVFGRQEQQWVLDLIIMAALLMVTGSKLSIASSGKKPSAAQVEAKRAF